MTRHNTNTDTDTTDESKQGLDATTVTDNHDEESTSRLGETLGAFVYYLLSFPRLFFMGFWKRMKGGKSLGETLIIMGYQLRLRASGDAIVNVIYEDGVVKPTSATYHSDGTYFETDKGDKFSAKGLGYNPRRLAGKVPVVWALRVGSEITEPLEAAYARSRKLGNFQELNQPDGTTDVAVDVDPNRIHQGVQPGGQQPAVADGGTPHLDGMVLSFSEGWKLFGSKVTNEDMQKQEDRGKLAALDFKDSDTWKWILAVLGAMALGLFGPSLAASLAGGGGGSMIGGGLSLTLGGALL